MSTRIENVNGISRYNDEYAIYAMYILGTRVCPNYIDGLKIVHRRILQAMVNLNATPNSFKKTMTCIGETLKTHPHGDSSVGGAMKNMINWFNVYQPLLDPDGDWGSIDGDEQAAPRYNGACMNKFVMENMIDEFKKMPKMVDWVPTFDNLSQEAEYLPSKIPLLLINGSYAIGVGTMSSIASHNNTEVIDATLKLLDNPNAHVALVPDQCMECDIIDTDWKNIANTGHGSFIVRGKVNIIKEITKKQISDKKYLGCPAIEIISTPDYVTLNTIRDQITKAVDDKKIPQIIEIASDESKKDPNMMSCLLILKKGSDPNFVIDMLYRHSDLQKTQTENYLILYDYNATVWSQKELLLHWIEYDRLRMTRKYYQLLQKERTELSIKSAYIKTIESGKVDAVINMIRKKKDKDNNSAIEWCIKNVGLTTAQSRFILTRQVYELSDAYLSGYKDDAKKSQININNYENKILNTNLIDQDIKDELIAYKKTYGCKRRCNIISRAEINNIPKGIFKLIITENNFIKKIPENEPIGSLKDDRIKQMIKIDNVDDICIFDSMGKVYKLPVSKIPISDKSTNGCDIRLLVKKLTSNIVSVIGVPLLEELRKKKIKHFITVQSKFGNIKKLDLEDIMTATPSGIIYHKLGEGDFVNNVVITPDKVDVVAYSNNKALRYNSTQIQQMLRSTMGSKSMKTIDGVDGLLVLNPDITDIVVITEKGYINKFNQSGLALSQRGKSGNKVISLTRGDKIKSIIGVKDGFKLSVSTSNGKQDIDVSDIKSQSSISSGSKIIKGDIYKIKLHV